MSGLLRAAAVAATGVVIGLAGCQGDGEDPDATATSVDAFPDVPHFRGHLAVRLQSALPVLSGGACEPAVEAGQFCSADGDTFRALGEGRPATVVEVRTAPAGDHTAWETVVRFSPDDRARVRDAAEEAAGLGGVVLVLADDRLLEAVAPPALDATPRAHLLGLEKPEAWALVESFLMPVPSV